MNALFFWYECVNPACRCFGYYISSLIPLRICIECEQPLGKVDPYAASISALPEPLRTLAPDIDAVIDKMT